MSQQTFEIYGTFEARSIDDAFDRLAEHFEAMAAGNEGGMAMVLGKMDVTVRPTSHVPPPSSPPARPL